jgi:DNA-binding XRE family transcriptional regulator
MLVVVKKPPTEFVIQGNLPQKYMTMLKKDYGDHLEIEDDDQYELAEASEWYKEMKAKETPGGNLRFYRRLNKFTQPDLGKKLSVSKQKISNMENGIVPISRKMALELAELFGVPAGRFI